MKWLIRVALLLSVALNAYFIFDEIRVRRNREFGNALNSAMGGELSKATWNQGMEIFTNKIKNKKALLSKKYYYINVWTNWCAPCIKEMPWLDSLAGTLNKDVGYIFVSDISDKAATDCMKRKNYNLKNFTFLNDMSDFVSGICNEQRIKNKVYPMVLILDQKGKIHHYSTGAYENAKEAQEFVDIINKLP